MKAPKGCLFAVLSAPQSGEHGDYLLFAAHNAGDYVQCGSIGGSVISSDGVRIKA